MIYIYIYRARGRSDLQKRNIDDVRDWHHSHCFDADRVWHQTRRFNVIESADKTAPTRLAKASAKLPTVAVRDRQCCQRLALLSDWQHPYNFDAFRA